MAVPMFNKLLLLLQIFHFVDKISAVTLNLHEVAEKNLKADGQVLQNITYVGFIMCARQCASLPSCRRINFYKPHLKCELLSESGTTTSKKEDWWYVDNMEWLKRKNLAIKTTENQCTQREKQVILSSGIPHCVQVIPENCQGHVLSSEGHDGGVFTISPQGNRIFPVYCDFSAIYGPWTVIQRRIDDTGNFDRPWLDYKTGFGNLTGNFWLGNDKIHSLLAAGNYILRVDMERLDGTKVFAEYSTFYIAGEDDKYKLTVDGYNGTAGDPLQYHNNYFFSTKDSNNDGSDSRHCAQEYGAGWWFTYCYSGVLNGDGDERGNWYRSEYYFVKKCLYESERKIILSRFKSGTCSYFMIVFNAHRSRLP